MRILMLSQFYHPIIGGEERIVQDLSTELAQRGHDVSIATLWHEGFQDYEVNRGVQIFRVRSTMQRARWLYSEKDRQHAPPWPDPEAMQALERITTQVKPEIVHAHNWFVYSYLPVKWHTHTPLVLTLHDYSLSCAKRRLVYHRELCTGPGPIKCLDCCKAHYGAVKGIPTALSHSLMNRQLRGAVDMFLPVSRAVAARNGLIGTSLPFQVIPNFVPDEIVTGGTVTDSYTAQLPEDYILFVGDLSYDKGIHVLLKAYRELESAPPLVVIGRSLPETPTVFPPNVIYLNSWPHAAVMEAWRRCSFGIVPSFWPEPFGVVALEAMVAGRPVVASRIGGLPDIVVDDETGILVTPGDPTDLRAAIQRLLTDRNLRDQMGQAGQRRIALFRSSAIIPRIEQEYQTLLASKTSTNLQPAL